MADWRNTLYYGDNLDILKRHVPDESVDLVYLDPPFNSNRSYNVLFKAKDGTASDAQIQAFDDTWTWSHDDELLLDAMLDARDTPPKVSALLLSLRKLVGPSDMLSYLVMMTARLVELQRVLKPKGSLYLHCDPVASHYLKVMLDAIFGAEHFRNEIIWKRTTAHNSAKKWGPVHDVVLYYGKSQQVVWNGPRGGYEKEYLDRYYKFDDGNGRLYWRADLCASGVRNGRSGLPWRGFDPSSKGMHWKFTIERLDELDAGGRIYWPSGGTGWPQYKRYRDELKGKALGDIWDDVDRINPKAAERLGYPTQKPLALLERIILASSNEGDVVLDPFCGCGTTVDAAQRAYRRWIGIDITYLAVDLITKRLAATYGDDLRGTYRVLGIPTDAHGAAALAERSKLDFERWAVSLVNGHPNKRQVGDRGIDGRIIFRTAPDDLGEAIVSVKAGAVNPGMVRDLVGTVQRESAELGVFITLQPPTRGMVEEANASGAYEHPMTGNRYPKVQLIAVADLLKGAKVNMPTAQNPYFTAKPAPSDQLSLFAHTA